MATMREYGLIFSDLSVKIVQVFVDINTYGSFFLSPLNDALNNELQSYLNKNNICPVGVIPDTALYPSSFQQTRLRKCEQWEIDEYLLDYQQNLDI